MVTKTSEFDRRIDILERICTIDERGNERSEWVTYYRCAAGITFESQSAQIEESRTDYNTVAVFKVRYCRKAAAIVPERFCVKYNGQRFKILSAVDVSAAHQLIKIKAQIYQE